jgi:hypothetical protein
LNIFLFILSIVGIKGGYYKASPIDFISEIYLFTIFYFFSRRYNEIISLGKLEGDRLIFNYFQDKALKGRANIITIL